MSCPRDGCCSLYASFSCTSLITVRPPPFQRISRDASTDRARTQQSAPTPDRTVRLPRAILRPSPASSRSSPPPDPPAASPASRDPHDVSARPPAGAGIAGVDCPSPGTLTSTLTPDRADAHHQGYPHHGCPPGKQPHHRPAQGPHPGAARARARSARRRAEATVEQREKERLRSRRRRREMTDQERKLESRKRNERRTRARNIQPRAIVPARGAPEDSAAPTASVASHAPPPLDPSAVARGGDDPGRPPRATAMATAPTRAERRGRPRNNARRSASVRWLGVRR